MRGIGLGAALPRMPRFGRRKRSLSEDELHRIIVESARQAGREAGSPIGPGATCSPEEAEHHIAYAVPAAEQVAAARAQVSEAVKAFAVAWSTRRVAEWRGEGEGALELGEELVAEREAELRAAWAKYEHACFDLGMVVQQVGSWGLSREDVARIFAHAGVKMGDDDPADGGAG